MITNTSIGRYGRFGNMLFQVAAVIGIARKSGQPFGFLPFVNYDHKERFGSTEDVDLAKYFVYPLPQLAGDYPYLTKRKYEWGYHDIHLPNGSWDLEGHFQSEKYFKHCINEVRHYFRMKGENGPAPNTIALHVRRGDYDDRYHPIIGKDYYDKALSLFPEDWLVFVFSDDVNAAKGVLLKHDSQRLVFVDDAGYIDDFRIMKQCGHFICANSSYSLMAAILSDAPDKKIICPKNWFGPAWTVSMETKDIYPENAIVI